MAESVQFDLVAPERALASAKAHMVTAPGVDGDFSVMAGHAPFLTVLRPGVLTASFTGGASERYLVFGGFAEVGPDHITILAEEAMKPEELSAEDLGGRIKAAETALSEASNDDAARRAQTLNDLRALQSLGG